MKLLRNIFFSTLCSMTLQCAFICPIPAEDFAERKKRLEQQTEKPDLSLLERSKLIFQWEQILHESPNDPSCHAGMALAIVKNHVKLGQAAAHYRQALALSPSEENQQAIL